MKTFEKIQEGSDWFLKVTVSDANDNRIVSFTKFVDEASLDIFLTETSSTLTGQKENFEARIVELNSEIASIESLLNP